MCRRGGECRRPQNGGPLCLTVKKKISREIGFFLRHSPESLGRREKVTAWGWFSSLFRNCDPFSQEGVISRMVGGGGGYDVQAKEVRDNHGVLHFDGPTSTDQTVDHLWRYKIDSNIRLNCVCVYFLTVPMYPESDQIDLRPLLWERVTIDNGVSNLSPHFTVPLLSLVPRGWIQHFPVMSSWLKYVGK